jgi:hypothetical protein
MIFANKLKKNTITKIPRTIIEIISERLMELCKNVFIIPCEFQTQEEKYRRQFILLN